MPDLLRICTAGSVDDGKSTLIGRLLYESRAIYEDQLRSVEAISRHRSAGAIDYSLFTDGLKAEREQGITIDVAYRYFATARRTFILGDTPGHEQYTRNMATGASTSDLAILLVDVRHGLQPQSRRHVQIARLLGIAEFVLAVNKMDLVDFDRRAFEAICQEFDAELGGAHVQPIPMSALHGDNVTVRSRRTPWFDGPSLLEYLERVVVSRDDAARPFRFPVQLVLRPGAEFRGYAGQIVSGSVRPGNPIRVQPSGLGSTVKRIVTRNGDLDLAHAPMSVTLVLSDDIDVSRGDVLTTGDAESAARFESDLVWMDERPLDPGRLYLVKQATRTVTAEIDRALSLNEWRRVTVTASRPLVFDPYTENRATGCFIVIDPATYFTAGAGMIACAARPHAAVDARHQTAERLARLARAAASDTEAADAVHRALAEVLT